MQRIDLIIATKGTKVCLQITPNGDVITYVVAVVNWDGNTLVTWHPAELEVPGGACFILGSDAGYNLVLKAAIRPGGAAAIDAVVTMNDPTQPGPDTNQYHVDLPDDQDREWSIAMK